MQMCFEAVLESLSGAPSPVFARLPFEPLSAWPESATARPRLRVQGTIRPVCQTAKTESEFRFSRSLLYKLHNSYFLVLIRKMQRGANVQLGSRVAILMEPDLDTEVKPPPELTRLFKQDRSVKKWFDTLNYSTRKYIAENTSEPKSAEAKIRRAERWVERLMLTMEGEQVLPPILQMAFRRQPLARTGWEQMTSNQRRTQLLAIFCCQSTEAREKRVAWAIDEALEKVGAGSRGKHSRNSEYDEF